MNVVIKTKIMAKYFICRIAYEKQITDPISRDCGKLKKVNEPYLVNALSCTEAEARVTSEVAQYIKGEWSIKSIKAVNVAELICKPDDLSENWYQARIAVCVVDEVRGTENWVSNTVLVKADTFYWAYQSIVERFKDSIVDYKIVSLSESPIVDYIREEEKEKEKE